MDVVICYVFIEMFAQYVGRKINFSQRQSKYNVKEHP